MGISGISKVTAQEREAHAKIGERWCAACEQWLMFDKFSSSEQPTCRECRRARMMRLHKAKPEMAKRNNLRKNYGMSLETYNKIVESQNGLCAIHHGPSGNGYALAVDHNHVTGKVRGLLCPDGCNPGLGYFKDDPVRLRAAAAYLEAQREDVYLIEGAHFE